MSELTPIFVVGTNRSGTTITRNVLCKALGRGATNFEPRLFLSYEPYAGIMLALWKEQFDERDAQQVRGTLLNRLVIDPSKPVDESRGYGRFIDKDDFRDMVDHYLGKLQNKRTDKRKWVREFALDVFGTYAKNSGRPTPFFLDDTPSNLFCMKELVELFPNAKIIHSIRDGRLVADSFRSRGWLRGSWDLGMMTWHSRTLVGRQIGKGLPAENYREFDFTRSFEDPTAYFQQIFDFVGLEYDEKYLRMFDLDKTPRKASDRDQRENDKFAMLASDLAEEFGWPL